MLVSKSAPAGIAALAGMGFLALPASADAAAGSIGKKCSAQYQAAKEAGALNGRKWPQFYLDCAARIKANDSSTEDTAAKSKRKAAKVSAVDKNGEPLTPGRIAFRQRLHECSVEYQRDKAADDLRGRKWPQYWSACNTRIKQED